MSIIMSRRCTLTGKSAQFGNNVSHSNRRTRRRFNPNVQGISVASDALGQNVALKIPVSTLRSIEHNGGLDGYLLKTSNLKLTPEAVALKKKIKRALASKAAA
jgi:large subunit ribosomal protein L28